MLPKLKPKIKLDEVLEIIKANGLDLETSPLILVGIRGYYKNSMGAPKLNDRGIYDDALIWVDRDSGIMSFNGNCDPSKYRKGFGFGNEKGMASLNCGVWLYKTGIHGGKIPHAAFRQYDEVIVTRDGTKGSYQDKGHFGINIHRGGVNGTSSLGCQTLPPSQWEAFKALGYAAIKEYNLKCFPYLLTEVKE